MPWEEGRMETWMGGDLLLVNKEGGDRKGGVCVLVGRNGGGVKRKESRVEKNIFEK